MIGKTLPLYIKIANGIVKQIVTGELQIGSKLLPIRKLSQEYKITIKTSQNIVDYLVDKKIVVKDSTRGMYITKDIDLINDYYINNAFEYITIFLEEVRGVMKKEDIIKKMEEKVHDSYKEYK